MIPFRTQAEELFGEKRQMRAWIAWVAPSAAMVLILVLESMTNGVILTPLLSLVTLAVLAFFLSPGQMTVWAVVYCMAVLVVFRGAYFGPMVDPNAQAVVLVRTSSFFVGATITVVLNMTRWKAIGQFEAMRRIFERMPAAVLLSDGSGIIIFANRCAREIFERGVECIRGRSIFSLGSEAQKKGDRIKSYLELCDNPEKQTDSVLLLDGDGQRSYRFSQAGVVLLGCTCVMTTLVPDECPIQEPGQLKPSEV